MTDDEMQNTWGCGLVIASSHHGSKTFQDLDGKIRSDVTGYKLLSIEVCGTDANQTALLNASNFDMSRCLIGIGTYVGGDAKSQSMSTSTFTPSNQLATFMDVKSVSSPECLEQTVPLPYWVNCKDLTSGQHRAHEAKCLRALHKKLIIAKLKGKPYRALLIEYVLGGSGAGLSAEFLESIESLLKVFGIVMIADEILTGGCCGPTMAMTSAMPKSFCECVEFITMGKFL